MTTSSSGKKALNLVAAIAVTGLLILGWHFAVPKLGEIKPIYKLISYCIILFGATWVTSAALSFYSASKKTDVEKKVFSILSVRALVGLAVFLVYAGMVHGIVAFLFADGTKDLMLRTASVAKDGLAFIGFCMLLSGSLSAVTKRAWAVCLYAVISVVGILASYFVDSGNTYGIEVVVAVMAALTFIVFLIDALTAFKKIGVSATKFLASSVMYLLILCVVMVIRYFTPIRMENKYLMFAVSGAINFVAAVVIDIVIFVVMKLSGKDNKTAKA